VVAAVVARAVGPPLLGALRHRRRAG
jgi:hypothetical protein